ncbi:MAG: L,D-transpeptidase family protein [Saccharospirillaceae bacterium]|nr:L,D-transpeptidase family protein [Pseudomonadales bacterium]NRB81411.1 L,D-transpeptidase family protein [Saccharospirillaceae bacterium]
MMNNKIKHNINIHNGKAQPVLVTVILMIMCMGILVFALAANSNVTTYFPPSLVKKHLKQWISHPPRIKHEHKTARIYNLNNVMEIYQSNNYELIWFDNLDFKDEGYKFLTLLREAVADDRYFYRYSEIPFIHEVSKKSVFIKDITKLDILVTDAFVSFVQDSLNNDFVPDLNSHDHHNSEAVIVPLNEQIRYTTDDVVTWIIKHVSQNEISIALDTLVPSHDGYLAMREIFNHFIHVTSFQTWKPLPDGVPIRLNQEHIDIPLIRAQLHFFEMASSLVDKQLISYKDYFKSLQFNALTMKLDEELSLQIGLFQEQNGLENTGDIGPQTRKLLQIPPQRFIRKIALNMKRWRRLPDNLGDKYIFVNMAAFDLNLIENNKSIMKMKVIVGRPNRRTPTLIDPIRTLVLNPTWTVPTRIALLDIVPQARRDPNYLKSHNIEVLKGYGANTRVIDPSTVNWSKIRKGNLPFYFRQKSGYNNALGQVKFALPNDMAIYLHDTNHRELFSRDYRALSSGCVRVEKPLDLARALLEGKPNWDKSKIDKVLDHGKTTYVKLPKPVPLYLIYWTAFIDDNGKLQSRDDVYNWDRLQQIGNDVAVNDFSLAP